MRFLLFVEGYTEKQGVAAFVKRWLDAQRLQHVGVTPVNFKGSGRFVEDAPAKAEARLTERRANEVIAIIGLLDLYGLPDGYEQGITADERYEFAKQKIEQRVAQPRYRQFFAVHETEAWLLSDPGVFPRQVQPVINQLSARPERVNFDEPPATRLRAEYRRTLNREYKKPVDGPNLLRKLDPDTAAQKYPYLKQMLDEMLQLARDAGL